MNQFTRIAVVACAAALAAGTVRADLVGLRVFQEGPGGGGTPPPGPERWIYRVYAEFTDPSDSVDAWGADAGSSLGSAFVRNITTEGSTGSGFTNVPDSNSGNLAPLLPFTTRDWDTYMTIGVLYGIQAPGSVDGTTIHPSTPTFILNGSSAWTPNQSGYVFLNNPLANPQGRGEYRIIGNDTDTRVLLMQLVVHAGEHVEGSIGVAWISQSGLFFSRNSTFSSIPAAPSIAPLVFLLFGGRRIIRQGRE